MTRSVATNRAQWDALQTPTRAFAAPVERREGRGWRWRSGTRHNQGRNSRLHGSHARACKEITVHDLDRRGGPETGAGTGGGLPRQEGPAKAENGDCDTVGARTQSLGF